MPKHNTIIKQILKAYSFSKQWIKVTKYIIKISNILPLHIQNTFNLLLHITLRHKPCVLRTKVGKSYDLDFWCCYRIHHLNHPLNWVLCDTMRAQQKGKKLNNSYLWVSGGGYWWHGPYVVDLGWLSQNNVHG